MFSHHQTLTDRLNQFAHNARHHTPQTVKSRISTPPSETAFSFEDGYLALEKGIHLGVLSPDILLEYQTHPLEVIQSLRPDLRKSLGLPGALPGESLSKSDAEITVPVVDWKTISQKLEAAVREGVLAPQVLIFLQNDPVRILSILPLDAQR